MKAYPVKAIFQFGLSDFDQLFVYLPLEEAQAFFNKPGEVSVIEGFVDDPAHMDDVRMKIEQTIERPNILTDWRQRNKGFFDVLKVESDAIFLILTIIVAVASLLIVQGLVLLVKDKTREIAILRTMGASRGAVLRIFILTGVAIGLIGVTLGVAARRAAGAASRRRPPVPQPRLQPQPVPGAILFRPVAIADRGGEARSGRRGAAHARPVLRRHHLSRLAGGAARSRRGAAP